MMDVGMAGTGGESDGSKDNKPKVRLGEHHGDYGSGSVPISGSVRLYSLCAAVNSLNLGYDIGVSTNLGPLIQEDFGLTDVQRELLIGSLNFFAMFGALISYWFSDRYGRRTTFLIASFGFLNGLVIMALAQTYEQIFAGRMLVGLGVGVGFAIDPLYISEISPAKYRGQLVNYSEIGVNTGVVLGFSVGLLLSGGEIGKSWRQMCMMGMVFPVAMMFLTVGILPETPRWCVLNGLDDDAREVLADIYPKDFNVDLVIDDIKEALKREMLAEKSAGWSVIFHPTPAIRRMLFLGLLIPVAQQAAGIDAIQYYLLDVMKESGVSTEKERHIYLIMMGMFKLTCIVISSQLVDKLGRRIMIFVSLSGLIVALLTISVALSIDSALSSKAVLVGLAMYMGFYGLGLGPVAWLIPSEIFATSIRAKGVSLATFLNRGVATLMVSSFLSIQATITWSTFFVVLAIISAMTLLFLYFYLPETKGRSLEDMSLYFAEETNDFSILNAERQLRVESEQRRLPRGMDASSTTIQTELTQ